MPVNFFLVATAIHREHFLVTMLKKEIFTAKELDLRPLGKVIIFCVKQNLPIIYRFNADLRDCFAAFQYSMQQIYFERTNELSVSQSPLIPICCKRAKTQEY